MKVEAVPNISKYPKIKTFFKHISQKMSNSIAFEPMTFERAASIEDAKKYAWRHFEITNINVPHLKAANDLNRMLVKIYNMTEGQAQYPPDFFIYNKKNSRYDGSYSNYQVEAMYYPGFEYTIAHEILHFNHELQSPEEYILMGKPREIIAEGGHSFAYYDSYQSRHDFLKTVRHSVGAPATASIAELLAYTFEAYIKGKSLPQEVLKSYKLYNGPFADVMLKAYHIKSL